MQFAAGTKSRLLPLDALRGTVMVIMALDHSRDFFHSAAMSSSPEDLAKTTPAIFLTRWITHFCLPVFMFLAGVGIFLWWQRNPSRGRLSRYLFTRGLWLILLELTVMRLAYNFNFSLRGPVLLLVLWGFGVCMVTMSALIYLPLPALAVLSATVILLHNLLDRIPSTAFGSGGWLWVVFHQAGAFPFAGSAAVVAYPLIPWVAVMAAGFCFGRVFLLDAAARQRICFRLGLALCLAFVVVRTINRYGDPVPWSTQATPMFTFLSFLRCTKYPASLDFLLMTLGPALLVLACLDRVRLNAANPLVIFGRVPLFYFVAHFYLIHTFAALAAWSRYGNAAWNFLFQPLPSMGGPAGAFPAGFGYNLGVVYVVWALVVVSLYPLCLWFSRIKASRNDWWLQLL